jgi:hypothetical protein
MKVVGGAATCPTLTRIYFEVCLERRDVIMNRFPRTFVTTVLIAALLVAVAPAVQARPLAKPHVSVQPVGGDWLEAAIVWLNRLFQAEPQASPRKAYTTPTGGTTTQGANGGPFSGSCIDPNGSPCGGGMGPGGN